MFKTTIKKKLRGALAALLAICFVVTGGTLSVFANNGAGAGDPGAPHNASQTPTMGFDEGIAIFLIDHPSYIVDRI